MITKLDNELKKRPLFLLSVALLGVLNCLSSQAVYAENTGVKPVATNARHDGKKFDVSTHKPNFVLPISYNDKPNAADFPYDLDELDQVEMEFQFSLKVLVTQKLPWETDLFFAYSNHSFWQAYNEDISSPFRDTNHEPEMFTRTPINVYLGRWHIEDIELGFVHQSNGRSVPLSRSWNRIYVNIMSNYKDFSFAFKPWYRLPEKSKDQPLDPIGDDNPDIEDYLGSFEFISAYHYEGQTFAVTVHPGFGLKHKGSTEMTWSYPINNGVSVYLKYFYGYGRSLLDYDHKSNAFGIGFSISDW